MAANSYKLWLSQVTQQYPYSSNVAGEVDYALMTFHGLRPQNMPDGSRNQLLSLIGSLPVVSHQNQGRVVEVPIEVCLPIHYPVEAPIIWIRPDTNKTNLVIRMTDNVDGNGLVWGLDSLKQLRLVELLSHLQNIFAYQLPIVSAELSVNYNSGHNSHSSISGHNSNNTSVTLNTHSAHSTHSTSTAHIPVASNIQNQHQQQSQSQSHSQNQTQLQSQPHQHQYSAESHVNSPRELLKRKVIKFTEEQLKDYDSDLETILKANSVFNEGENVLNREKLMLNNEINLLLKEINAVEGKRVEMERLCVNTENDLEALFQRNLCVPVDPASSQLLELLANESALMDVLYSLIKITVTPPNNPKNQHVPLSTALRCIREISRKHFLTKAHIRKLNK